MKSLSFIITCFILSILFIPHTNAQHVCRVERDYYYNHEKNNYKNDRNSIIRFRERIDEGVWSGELTYREERLLKKHLNKLVRTENKAYRNGYISNRERRKIEKRKHKLNRLIYEKKHNRHVRY